MSSAQTPTEAPAAASNPASDLPPRMFPEMTEISENKKNQVNKFYETVWLPYSKGEQLPGDGEKKYVWPQIYQILDEEESRVWCYKLMIARKFDIEEAKKMLQTILEFRQEYNTERSYFPAPFPIKGFDIDALIEFTGQSEGPRPQNQDVDRTALHTATWQNICFHKTTKWGHPVSYENWGLQHPYLVPLSLKRLTDVSKGEKYIDPHLRFHLNMCETGIRLARFQDHTFAKKHNDKVSGILCICDMTGLGMHHFVNEFIAYLTALGEFDKKVYPEFLHHVLVINCPTIIRAAFAIVSPLIDARTQTKISFHAPGKATDEILKKWMHEDAIPEMHGGKCKCEGGCIRLPNYDEQEKEYQALLKHFKNGGTTDAAAALASSLDDDKHGDSVIMKNGLHDVGVEVPAGKSLARELIVKKDEAVSWEWLADEERTVEFSVQFEKEGEGKEPSSPITYVVKPDKIGKHSGSHKAEVDGKVKIVFGNEFSWMRSKYLTVKTALHSETKSIHIDGEEELKKKESEAEAGGEEEKKE